MPWDFDTVGWESFDNHRHEGKPSDLDDTGGMLVHAYNPDSGEHEYFWAFVYDAFQDWEEWLDYIGSLMEMYGMSL